MDEKEAQEWQDKLDRVFNEPPTPEQLAKAGRALERMRKYDEWFASLTAESKMRRNSFAARTFRPSWT